jgi:hypothetical protein
MIVLARSVQFWTILVQIVDSAGLKLMQRQYARVAQLRCWYTQEAHASALHVCGTHDAIPR